MAVSHLRVVGGFRLTLDDRDVPVPPACQRLLCLVGLRGPGPRPRVAGTLWGDQPDPKALACLRTALWRLGRLGLIMIEPRSGLLCRPPGLCLDADDPSALVASWTHRQARTGGLDHELLPGWYDDWVLLERERLRHAILRRVEERADQAIAAADISAALHWSDLAVDLDPLRESAHRLVIRAHLVDGNVAEARRHARRTAELLQRELGVPPSLLLTGLLTGPSSGDARPTQR